MKKILNIIALLLVIICLVGCGRIENTNNENLSLCTLLPVAEIEEETNSVEETNNKADVPIYQEQSILFGLKSVDLFIESNNKDLSVLSSLSIEYIRFGLTGGTDKRARESLKPYKITNFGKFTSIEYANCVVNVKNIGMNLTLTFNDVNFSISNKQANFGYLKETKLLIAEILLDQESGLRIKVVGYLETIE